MAQLAGRCEPPILDRHNDRLPRVERGADLARITLAQPGACRAARNEAAIDESGKGEVSVPFDPKPMTAK